MGSTPDVELYYQGDRAVCSDVLSALCDRKLAQCFLGRMTLGELLSNNVRYLGDNSCLVDDLVEVVIKPTGQTPYHLSKNEGADLAEIAAHQPEGRHVITYNGIDYWALVRYR